MATTADTPTTGTAGTGASVELSPGLDQVRTALSHMFGAERRLRGRDHASGDLTHAQIRSLHALGEAGELSAGQLAKSADLNPASVTAMLDHLEESGIVSRSRSTTDRRVTIVSLTPKGRDLLAEKSAKWREMWTARLERFSESELEVAARVIREIGELMDSVAVAKESAAQSSAAPEA
jgi:MarR family transcriptional regulator, organic hydroperoxide resistance regulator